MVLVDKPDGSIRFCVDYKKPNHITNPDAYPMPRLDDLIETIGRCQFISSLDLTKGFWQMKLDPKYQEKSGFCSPFGLYEFCILPFGLWNSLVTFQRLIDQTLQGLRNFTVTTIHKVTSVSYTHLTLPTKA